MTTRDGHAAQGEHTTGFPTERRVEPGVDRIGVRKVTVPATGTSGLQSATATVSFNPAAFRCTRLAGALVDEWVELVQAARLREGAARAYLTAIKALLIYVDAEVPGAGSASLGPRRPRPALGGRRMGPRPAVAASGRIADAGLERRTDSGPDCPARRAPGPAGGRALGRLDQRCPRGSPRLERHQLQDKLDAAVIVIAALTNENAALGRQAMNSSTRIVPLISDHGR
jgi:hypothetical protein